jgi:tetratricopeptide (TPR) repeat protein/TolB-like protein/tRNA A-37 threonylcarbamoyl transferase component Bud32
MQQAVKISEFAGDRTDRFVIQAKLGSGAMGEVFLAEDRLLKRRVALKVIRLDRGDDAAFRHRMQKEAERASQLNDPHIAAIYDLIEQDGRLFLVMEYVEGQTLRERLREPLTTAEFFSIAEQCLAGVAAAHQHGIVHCDLKPENLMVTPEGMIKILDFGFAQPTPQAGATETLSCATLGGTPGYISPEVLLGGIPDERSDVFSLGVVLYEALAGRHPFRVDPATSTSGHALRCDPPPLPHSAPAGMNEVLALMLAKEPAQRYQSCTRVLVDIRTIHGGDGPAVEKKRFTSRVWPPRLMWLAAAVTLIVLIAQLLRGSLMPMPWSAVPVNASSPQLAVLPFETTAQDANSRAFAGGLTETLAAKLGEIADRYPLEIISAAEVRKQNVHDAKHARSLLGATLILEGSLQQSGNTVRIIYSMVDTRSLRQVHSGVITADNTNIFAVQDRVIAEVLKKLDIELAKEDRGRVEKHGTTQPEAYDYYLRGRGYLQDYDRLESLDNAIAEFQRSLRLDPRFALAHAGLGQAFLHKSALAHSPESLEAANDDCRHSAQLDPSGPDAEICLGMLFNATGRYDAAAQHLENALKLDPTRDESYRELAIAYEGEKRLSDAESLLKKAVALRPHYWAAYKWLGRFYEAHGRYDEAAEQFKRVVDMASDSADGYSNLGAVYVEQGKYAEAIDALERSIRIQPTASALNNVGAVYFYQRRYADAARSYELATQLTPDDYRIFGNLGEAYAQMEGHEEAERKSYAQALKLAEQRLVANGNDGDALLQAALYAAMLGQNAKAEEYRKSGIALSGHDPEARFNSALVLAQMHQDGRALAELDRALAGGLPASEVTDNPAWRRFAANPRFAAVMAKARNKQ